MLKIDIHTHILPPTLPNLSAVAGAKGLVSLHHHRPGSAKLTIDGKEFREVGENCWNPARRLEDCDRFGVDVQVLSPIPVLFYYGQPAELALTSARHLNDFIAQTVSRHPRRFTALGTVPLQSLDLAIAELRRCKEELGFPGVEIGTNVRGKNLDDPELFSFFAAAADLKMALFVHPWDVLAPDRMSHHWLSWLIGMPTETAMAIASMILGGVFERLPNLRVAFAHGGGSFPALFPRIAHGHSVQPNLVARGSTLQPEEWFGRFYVDTLVFDPDLLSRLIRLMGSGRIAIGSDYPFPLGEDRPGQIVSSLTDLSEIDRENLSSTAALNWLGLTANHFGSARYA